MIINRDKAALIGFNLNCFQIESFGIGYTAYRDDETIAF